MNEPKTRLALLIRAMKNAGLDQATIAKRAGLSLPYVKKLKAGSGDKRQMTKKAAVAIAAAFGVDYDWILGKGRDLPIMARFGQEWTTDVAKSIQSRKTSKQSRAEDAAHCTQWFVINADRLARIIVKGYKSKKAMLCLSRIDSALSDLMKDFEVQPEPVKFNYAEWHNGGKWNESKSPQIITAQIADRLIGELDKEVSETPEPLASKPKTPAKPPRR